jgi:peptidoglycan hydrolase-like protein with peptidoglycan-binding domain
MTQVTGRTRTGTTTSSANAPLLAVGARGPSVEALQKQLRAMGYTLTVDGVFGKETQSVVMQAQKKANITADGIVGPKTRAALKLDTTTTTNGAEKPPRKTWTPDPNVQRTRDGSHLNRPEPEPPPKKKTGRTRDGSHLIPQTPEPPPTKRTGRTRD